MFRALGQTIPEQIPGIITYVTQASADCSRVLTEEIDIMRAHARSPNLTPEQSTELLQLINTNYEKCGGTSSGHTSGSNGGFALPTNLMWIGAAALVVLLLLKR